MNTIVILSALDLEYRAIRRHLSAPQLRHHHAGTIFEVGQLSDAHGTVALGVTGEGNVGAAILAERSIAMFRPCAILCVGVAGALKRDIALGDIVVATRILAVDGGRDHEGGFAARPRAWGASHELEQVARQVARSDKWTATIPFASRLDTPAVHFKPIASGEVVYHSAHIGPPRRIRDSYDDAVAVEMESVGIAHASHLNRALPTLTIRGISDRADNSKASTDAACWPHVAAARAAAFAVAVASVLLRHTSITDRASSRKRLPAGV